ncbi:hypothetical protein M3T53_09125 [Actinomyces sp. B33]|uniref:hypothetical protein n=1 Tax=Actinomyces sp. B33 TaxID=2942131 RepID=UPI002340B7CB|nr:hypothetical protein [Actinomyces sp. B33]MDC4233861.1 hypothetical protein [Actinomyces sp. B33]
MLLRPGTAVLWNGADSLRIGGDPASGVVLDALTPEEQAWVHACARIASHRLDHPLSRRPCPPPPPGAGRIEAALEAAGLVDRPEPRTAARLHLDGLCAACLSSIGVIAESVDVAVTISSPGVVERDLARVVGEDRLGQDRAFSAREHLARLVPSARSSFSGSPGLVLVSAERRADPEATLRWVREEIPHLVVTRLESGYEIGPLVMPGATTCHQCVEARRIGDDPARLIHLRDLPTWPLPPTPARASCAASLVIADLVEAAIRGRATPEECQQLVRVDSRGVLSRTAVPPEPGCACGAAGCPPGLERAA